MAVDRAVTPSVRRTLRRGVVVKAMLLGVLLGPVLFLVFAVPHQGWIDFYQIFSGVQGLWRGENPYQELYYYYPPWTALVLAPLAVFPYDPGAGVFDAALAWFWLALAAYLTTMVCWLPALGIRLRSLDGALVVAGGLLFAPVLQSLIHGQSVPLLLLAVAVLGTRPGRHPLVAGLALATLTIKPQVGGLILGGVALRLLANRCYAPLASFAAVMTFFLGGSFLLLPSWPWDWLAKLPDGHLYTQGSPSPPFILPELGLPEPMALGLSLSVSAALGAWYVRTSWMGRGRAPDPDFIAAGASISLLAAPYSHSYDYVLLLLPALVVLNRLRAQPPLPRFFLVAGLAVAYFIPLGRFLHLVPGSLTLLSGVIVTAALAATRSATSPGKIGAHAGSPRQDGPA